MRAEIASASGGPDATIAPELATLTARLHKARALHLEATPLYGAVEAAHTAAFELRTWEMDHHGGQNEGARLWRAWGAAQDELVRLEKRIEPALSRAKGG